MANPFTMKSWSPYLAGAGIGLLSWFAFATADHPIGVTTAFEHSAALAEKAVVPQVEQTNEYFAEKKAEVKPPQISWEWMLVVGVFVGAIVSSTLSGDRGAPVVSPLWRAGFGDRALVRLAFAFGAGALMMLGARLVQGCTSGHGISGTLQLAVSRWVFIIVAFGAAAMLIDLLMRRGTPAVSGTPQRASAHR